MKREPLPSRVYSVTGGRSSHRIEILSMVIVGVSAAVVTIYAIASLIAAGT